MRSLLVAVAAAAMLAAALPSPANARCFGCGVAAGVVAGTIIGSAIAAPPPPPVYYAPPPPPYADPPPDYIDGPICHTEQQQVWDGRAWRSRNIQVCD